MILTFPVEVIFVECCSQIDPLYHVGAVGLPVVRTVPVTPIGVARVEQGESSGEAGGVPILALRIGRGLGGILSGFRGGLAGEGDFPLRFAADLVAEVGATGMKGQKN